MDIQPSLGRTETAALSLVDLMTAATELSSEEEGEDDSDTEEDDASSTLPNNPIHQFTTPVNPVKPARPAPPIRGASFQFVDQETVKSSVLKSLLGDEVDMIELAAERRQTVDSIFSGETAKPAVVDPKERYRKIVESYGEWCDDSEYFIESIPAALYRGVLIKGLASLTNRRLLFFAYVPEALPGVVRSGAVRISYPGLKRSQLVWAELKSESFSYYASSKRTTKPILSGRLSQLKTIYPYDSDAPKSFRIDLIDGRERKFEFDTIEATLAWRNDLEATLFTFRQNSDTLRLSIPLELISNLEVQPYFSLAERITVTFCSDYVEDRLDDRSTATQTTLELGYLNSHHSFSLSLKSQQKEAKAHPAACHVQPILEIDEGVTEVENTKLQAELTKESKGDNRLALKFVESFALAETEIETLLISPSCELIRLLPAWGSLAISKYYLCFWRRSLLGEDIKLRVPLVDIDDAFPTKAFGFRIFGLSVQVHGSEDIRFDFTSRASRDDVVNQIQAAIVRVANEAANLAAQHPRQRHRDNSMVLGEDINETVAADTPGIQTDHRQVDLPIILNVKSNRAEMRPRHFVCMTIGSRGDVQPYIVLGRELMKDGHRVTIASHPEYRDWVESFGIGYREVGGDPQALMEINIKHKIFSPGFFKESITNFRSWIDVLLVEAWEACQGADVLIESPVTMAGIHVAEALHIPYIRCFTMPWTSTSAYPQAFTAAGADLGPIYNQLSYSLFDTIYWKATASQINRWRQNTLQIKPTNLHKLSAAKTPFIYNFSSFVIPRPNDYPDWIDVSGYWFLDTPNEDWNPPQSLLSFIDKARADEKPVVYIGFGSIVVPDSAALTKAIVGAVIASDVRAIVAKGWSERGRQASEVIECDSIYRVDSIQHDRLFPLIDATVTHGGSGSTGASLRAGLPTLIHPFFGDQHFWATTVTSLQAGARIESLSEKDLTKALKLGTSDRIMKQKAQMIGEKIRSEDGPKHAIEFIYSHLHLAAERTEIRSARASHVKKAPLNNLRLDNLARSLSFSTSSRSASPNRSSSSGSHAKSPKSRSPATTTPSTPTESFFKSITRFAGSEKAEKDKLESSSIVQLI